MPLNKAILNTYLQKDNQLIFQSLECNKSHNKDFNKDLIKKLVNTYEFCDRDINKLLLLRKGIYANTWLAGKDLMKHYCLIKKIFTVI